MVWTEEAIIAEFRQCIVYWQKKLRLQDIVFYVRVCDDIADDKNAWCSVRRYHGDSDPYAVDLRIRRGWYDQETRYTVWTTTAHECIHVMNWAMSHAFEALEDHFSVAQMNMAKSLMKTGNEQLAYKWEVVLADFFAADAPPKEIPA